jgi:hypothetical protein
LLVLFYYKGAGKPHLAVELRTHCAQLFIAFCLTLVTVECPDMLKGAIELDAAASVQRTKNARDGFEYCIRIDAPNAGQGAGVAAAAQPKVKRWTKLVMVLRSEPEMAAWLAAIRWGLVPNAGSVRGTAAVHAVPDQAWSEAAF